MTLKISGFKYDAFENKGNVNQDASSTKMTAGEAATMAEASSASSEKPKEAAPTPKFPLGHSVKVAGYQDICLQMGGNHRGSVNSEPKFQSHLTSIAQSKLPMSEKCAMIEKVQDELMPDELYGTKNLMPVDTSPELEALIKEAEKLKKLPERDKLAAVIKLTCGALPKNAWEGQYTGTEQEKAKSKDLVFNAENPLSAALKAKEGCCRYQAVLFFILSHAAELGKRHYLQCSKFGGGAETCWNQVVFKNGESVAVSIFLHTLNDPKYDYTQNAPVFQKPVEHCLGRRFFSYHESKKGGMKLYAMRSAHGYLDKSLNLPPPQNFPIKQIIGVKKAS